MVRADSHKISGVTWYSGYSKKKFWFRIHGSHVLWPPIPRRSAYRNFFFNGVLQPPVASTCVHSTGFGLFRFRSPLLTKYHSVSFPPGTKMFQFPGLPRSGLWIHPAVPGHDSRGVPPFGNVRINACRRLLAHYRGLPRPSSAAGAKVSTESPL